MKATILVVDDEQDILAMVKSNLGKAGYNVITARDGEEAISIAREESPDLMVLDVMLPSVSGLEVCRTLKGNPRTAKMPVLMLSARHEEIDRVVGFELGADDFVAKPFSPRELVLRIQALLRRCGDWRRTARPRKNSIEPRHESGVLKTGSITLDHENYEVRVGGRPVDFSRTEFKLLSVLLERAGRVLSRESLLNEVWGYENGAETRTLDMHVLRLREKLGREAGCLQTVRGFGYRINAHRSQGQS
jgi:two-component system, OmpR family, phosphate regulon response regulator PhoB